MVSLKDIAQYCGVSTATVSKALNDQSDIGQKTKERIRQVANDMGYFPNSAARALKTNKSHNIGVLFQDEANSGLKHDYFSGVLNGFKVCAEEKGYDVTFINTFFENRKMSYYEHCKYRNFDGIVIVCVDFREPGVQELISSDIPVVTIDYVNHDCPAVSSNNVKGIQDLLQYVYERGHRRIAYIHGQDGSFVTRERLTSFYRTAEELGLEIPENYVREADYLQTEKSEEETRQLLKLKNPPTCIFYPDDTSYIGGRNAIRSMGLRIPDDISVVGYDGNRVGQLLYPRVTTIGQDTDLIGKRAAEILVDTIERPKITLCSHEIVDGILLEGESVADIRVE